MNQQLLVRRVRRWHWWFSFGLSWLVVATMSGASVALWYMLALPWWCGMWLGALAVPITNRLERAWTKRWIHTANYDLAIEKIYDCVKSDHRSEAVASLVGGDPHLLRTLGGHVVRPPCTRLRGLTSFVFSQREYERFYEPVLDDAVLEWQRAHERNEQLRARWISVRAHVLVLQVVLIRFVTSWRSLNK